MLSDEIIEARANLVRKKLGIEQTFAFDVQSALEKLQHVAKNFSFRVGSFDELGTDDAIMDYDSDTLVAHEYLFDDLKSGRVRARFTIAHELGHFFLGHKGRRARNRDKLTYGTAEKRTAEAEANMFASYLLIPTDLAIFCDSASEIAEKFSVSLEAADIAFNRIQAAKRKLLGQQRSSPPKVIDFLKECRRRGLKVRSIPDTQGKE